MYRISTVFTVYRGYYLERYCYCGKFDNAAELHYSPQCHYVTIKDTGNNRTFLLLRCRCNYPTLINADPKPSSCEIM